MPLFSKSIGLATVGASVVSKIADRDNKREEIQAQAAEAKLRTSKAEALNDPDLIKNQIKALNAQAKTTLDLRAKQLTTDQFRLYIKTGNPIHLTNWLKNEQVNKQFGGIVSIEQLNPETDLRLLTEKGIKIEDFRPSRHLKAIMPDGTAKLFDAFDVAVGTGALLAILSEEADLVNKWIKASGKDGTTLKGELFHNAQAVASLLPEESEESAMRSLFDKKKSGILPGKEQEAEQALDDLVKVFGGEEGFFATDFSIESNRILAARDFRRYKRFGGQDLNSVQQGKIIDLSKLVILAGTVGDKLTPKVTGVYDTFLRKIRKYISDNVEDVDKVAAESSYEAFRGMFRHALAGTALTDNEIELFNTTYGTISQQYPLVAAQFITMLNEVKAQLETIALLNDPFLAHYYLGTKTNNVNGIINRINERLELISQAQGNEPGKFADQTREGSGDDQIVIPNDPTDRDPTDVPLLDTTKTIEELFEESFGQ